MKFVKDNLDLLITALVVVVAFAAWWFMVVPWQEDLDKQATARQTMDAKVTGLIFDARKPLPIPGIGNVPDSGAKLYNKEGREVDPKTLKIVPTDNFIQAREQAQKDIKAATAKLIANASDLNSFRRAEVKTGPNNTRIVTPLLANGTVRAENLLPAIQDSRYAWAFRDQYLKQFELWQARLSYTPLLTGVAREGAVSHVEALKDLANRKINEIAAERALNARAGGGAPVVTTALPQLPQDEKNKITKSVIAERAMRIKIYLDDLALPRREWAKPNASSPPTANEVFEGLVDSWLINDAINAIAEVNKQSADVGTSPIKHLEEIRVRGGGSLLLAGTSTSSSTTDYPSGPPDMNRFSPGGNPPPFMPNGGGERTSAPDATKSMTGHTGDNVYDVVQMTVKVVIDPTYVNRFQEELYKQNNGYTVIHMKITHVDPLDAAANGYLYGNTQCVRVEFTVEDLLFRSWLDPIKPTRR